MMEPDFDTEIKGVQRKKVPFFNPDDESYFDYASVPVDSFSTNLFDYLERDVDDYITNLFDLLIPPHYVIDKKNDPVFEYSSVLMELFYLLYRQLGKLGNPCFLKLLKFYLASTTPHIRH